jgi:uncharacterized membrane protein YoaK (UPF0700 family)
VADYFVPRVYGAVRHVPVGTAREQTGTLSKLEQRAFLLDHPGSSLAVFAGLIVENVAARSNAIPPERRLPYLYMRGWNAAALLAHVGMGAALLLALWRDPNRRGWIETALLLALPVGAVIGTAGLTYWQGDRIVLPVLPVWLVLYALVLTRLKTEAARRS